MKMILQSLNVTRLSKVLGLHNVIISEMCLSPVKVKKYSHIEGFLVIINNNGDNYVMRHYITLVCYRIIIQI